MIGGSEVNVTKRKAKAQAVEVPGREKGVTLADLQRQLDDTGRLSIEDVYSLVDAVNEGRRKERDLLRHKSRRRKTGS